MFVGRANETQRLKAFINSKKSAAIVYGLRRIGKTTLIKKVLEDNKTNYVYFECQKASETTNVNLFVDTLKEQIGFVDASFSSFLSVFKEIDKQFKDYVFVIDEYSFMKQYYLESKKTDSKLMAKQIDSEFQNIIDTTLTNNKIILSGSSINIMERLTDHQSPLYGRFNEIIVLRELTYLEAKDMFPTLSNDDFVAFYSVFGGSPYVLEKIDASKSLKENICELVIKEEGSLRIHLNSNVINELENDSDLHDILDVIKNGCKKYKDIEDKSHITTSGLLDKRLKKLLELDIIEVKYLVGKEDNKRKKLYEIKDNLLKFYYSYIFRQDNRINFLGSERYYDLYISPSIKEFISRRFENIVKSYFSIAIKKGMYKDIIDIGTYFFDNNEYDCVIKYINDTYGIYEVKYYSNPMKKQDMEKELSQIKDIKGLNITGIGFVCNKGFETKLPDIFYLDLDDIFFC